MRDGWKGLGRGCWKTVGGRSRRDWWMRIRKSGREKGWRIRLIEVEERVEC